MVDVYIDNKKVKLNPSKAIGKGGEADVYEYKGKAVKIFKGENHPDFSNDKNAKDHAKKRIEIHQKKLLQFPLNLPSTIIRPLSLAKDKDGKVVGYIMEKVSGGEMLFKYSEKSFRKTGRAN